mmetsp:Transcript_15906/g.37700  ORF Transcript_15906/g.37700 Transcript_15906/m.37700 type:complete len:290 (+) Transcript_15906:337-1206(+)
MGFLQSAAGLRSSPVTEKFSCTQGLKTKLPVRKVVFRTEAANYAVDDHGQLARPEDLPLSGKRVLVTAPRRYASRLVGRLVEAGALPLWIPTIEITALNRPDDLKSLDDALTCLEDYTHIAFTSSNGITAVLDRLEALHGGKAGALKAVHRAGLRCCALGADADVLESHGVPCSIRPKEASTLGLVKELVDRGEAEGASVLCPVPLVEGARPRLAWLSGLTRSLFSSTPLFMPPVCLPQIAVHTCSAAVPHSAALPTLRDCSDSFQTTVMHTEKIYSSGLEIITGEAHR